MTPDPALPILYGGFTSSSSYKPTPYLARARLPFSFRAANLKNGDQQTPGYLALNPLPYDLIPRKDTEFDPCA